MKKFVPLKRFENTYEINKLGEIRSIDRITTTKGSNGRNDYKVFRKGVSIKRFINDSGYLITSLNVDGKKYSEYIHKLVYDTFVGIKDYNNDVDHLDHNKLNCSLDNLEEISHRENIKRMRAFYGTEAKPKIKTSRRKYTLDEMQLVLEKLKYSSMCQVSKEYGLSDKGLSKRLESVGLPYKMKDIKKYFEDN